MATASSSVTPQPPPATGCAGLPHDVLRSVFIRLGRGSTSSSGAPGPPAPRCGASRHEPALWRRIDLTPPAVDEVGMDDSDAGAKSLEDPTTVTTPSATGCSTRTLAAADAEVKYHHAAMGWKEMERAAVDRSAGRCEAFCGRVDDDVLLYLADRAPSLRSRRVTSSHRDVSSEAFSELINKFPLLEELELVLSDLILKVKSDK
ncbi:hypothetical protein SETIT_3G317000v2 [Setaria italica]|uniref:F-box domain-containing protein n=1 Tax=Setaria italica TaxID=4555 RepID=A0A368QLK1_SETIT|nr:hypothetical protein SETIT_3G317000v2 [Setaria italica]